mmetsp:Transcript_17137/g.53739  ORF Transcript_17137/g.53739 Transcript_17137/m.53739 type:complete len:187 (-) Transcript_17137:44-604(-)
MEEQKSHEPEKVDGDKLQKAPAEQGEGSETLCSAASLDEADMKVLLHRYAETVADALKNWAGAWEEDRAKLQAIMAGSEIPATVATLLKAAAEVLRCEAADVLPQVQSGALLASYRLEEGRAYASAEAFQNLEGIWSTEFDDYSYCLMLLRNWVFDVLALANNFPDAKQRPMIGSMADLASLMEGA